MLNKKSLCVCFFALWISFLGNIVAADPLKIRFAVIIYPPFTTLNNDQKLEGFDIDLAKALCARLNAQCTFTVDQLADMTCSLKSNVYDAWLGALTIHKERQKGLAFSKPYFTTNALLIAPKNTTFNSTPIEMKNKVIGVENHSCYLEYLKGTYGKNVKIVTFSNIEHALRALAKKEVDTVIDDKMSLKHWRMLQKDAQEYRLIEFPAKYTNLIWHSYGIAVNKDNTDLLANLNRALVAVRANGTLATLLKKYNIN